MTKITRKQQTIAYWAATVQEWRGAGKWAESSIRRMVVEAMEHSEVCGQRDVTTIFEIADGVRCA